MVRVTDLEVGVPPAHHRGGVSRVPVSGRGGRQRQTDQSHTGVQLRQSGQADQTYGKTTSVAKATLELATHQTSLEASVYPKVLIE